MPTIHAPKYSKLLNSKTGTMDPCYVFMAEHSDSEKKMSIVVEDSSLLSITGLEQALREHTEWWNGWIGTFLEATAKHFSKPYTVQHIHKITKHHITTTEYSLFPATVVFYPKIIQIHGGVVGVEWAYEITPVTIEIPDWEEEPLPVSVEVVQEMNIEEVPVDPNATEDALSLETPTKFYEKNKVKEARLRAKIALYRAQHQMNKYYEKYGTEVTDSDTEEEEEEIQL